METVQKTNYWVWYALAATIAAVIWVNASDGVEPENPVPERRFTNAGRVKNILPEHRDKFSIIGLPRARIESQPQPLFEDKGKAAAIQHAADQIAKPQVPSLPFTYVGKLIEDGRYTIFLLSGERSFAVHEGELIEDAWRVKEIRPPEMTFLYLPLKAKAVLDIGESK